MDEEFIEEAEDIEIDGQKILEMNDRVLMKALGMKKEPLAYLQFKVLISRKYGSSPSSVLPAVHCPPTKVIEFFRKYPELQDAIPCVRKYGIDGEMLLDLIENDVTLKKLIDKVSKRSQDNHTI